MRQEATNQENKRPDEVCSGGVSNICLVVYVVIVKRPLLRDPYIIPKPTGFHVRKVSKQEILSGNPLPPRHRKSKEKTNTIHPYSTHEQFVVPVAATSTPLHVARNKDPTVKLSEDDCK